MNDIIPRSDQSVEAPQRSSRQVYVTPVVDVESTKEGFVLRAEMPGVNKEGIEVTVENGDLVSLATATHLLSMASQSIWSGAQRIIDEPMSWIRQSILPDFGSYRTGYPDRDAAEGRKHQAEKDCGRLI